MLVEFFEKINLKFKNNNMNLEIKRHSLAHIIAQAVKELYPDVKLAIWPATDDWFYYDFDFGETEFSDNDLKEVEKKMKKIISQNQKFEQFNLSIDDSISEFKKDEDIYKLELALKLKEQGETELSFYKNISQQWDYKFIDMCRWPHVEKMSELDANSFKLARVAWAYWLWDEKNKQLTRIYAYAFNNRDELQVHLKMLEEAKKRDHRIIWAKLKLFTVSDLVWPGLPLMQPAWMILRQSIEDYLWELHLGRGYERVWSPHIAKECLYETSGHAEKFGDELFRVQGKEDSFILKPMNCPHHMQIFADNQFSYRDMPIRYFEPATVYRDEKSGQLWGLTRVRAITQDDGHLFCRVDQIKDEVKTITDIIKEFYTTIWMTDDYWVSLSVRWEDKSKYLWWDDIWEQAEAALELASKENKLPYKRIEWEAAFYGPKLDFMFKDAIWREWQLATIQCDFNLPIRFDLNFTNNKWEKERPVVIHRAISWSLERWMWVFIEHFAWTFPLWMSPRQVKIVPVMDKFFDYAVMVEKELKSAWIRVSWDYSSDWLNKKVRNAEKMHNNYILVIWEQEEKDNTVSVRNYKTKEQSIEKNEEFKNRILKEIKNRSL